MNFQRKNVFSLKNRIKKIVEATNQPMNSFVERYTQFVKHFKWGIIIFWAACTQKTQHTSIFHLSPF